MRVIRMGATLRKSRYQIPSMKLLFCGLLAVSVLNGPAAALMPPKHSGLATGYPLVQLAHGFHCRRMFGWDPRLGIYHWHRHEGICRDHHRCMKVMYRCDLLMGKGWEPWSYERWGFDNWRFDKCMLDAGCY